MKQRTGIKLHHATNKERAVPATLSFYYDYISPYTYMAWTQLDPLASATGASVSYRPFNLRQLMPLVGNRPTTVECANKGRYAFRDLGRWAGRYGVPFAMNPNWGKFDHSPMLRGALAALDQGVIEAYNRAMFAAMWAEGANLGERSVFTSVLDRAGLNGAAITEVAFSTECQDQLDRNVKEAAERGVFGSPTFFVGDDQYFGNDRLDFVREALAA